MPILQILKLPETSLKRVRNVRSMAENKADRVLSDELVSVDPLSFSARV